MAEYGWMAEVITFSQFAGAGNVKLEVMPLLTFTQALDFA
jgi:hypothetical protein